jgi:hypothetical protein
MNEHRGPTTIRREDVEALLASGFIDADGTRLRDEDRKKAVEVHALLLEIDRLVARRKRAVVMVDAAAGKSYLGLLAARLVFAPRTLDYTLVAIERDEKRVAMSRDAATRLGVGARFEARATSVGSGAFPEAPTLVVALHACGEASDAVIDATLERRAAHLLLVPCCTARGLRGEAPSAHIEANYGVPRHGGIRRRLREVLVLAERVARLEAAGYATEVVDFVAPTVTPYNVLLRARRVDEPVRRARAAEEHARLRDPSGRA